MSPEDRVELAVRRTASRMAKEFPQNLDVLKMLDVLAEELVLASKSASPE